MDTTPNDHQFGIMVWQDMQPATLIERFQHVEQLGFDQLFLPDHIGDFRDLSQPLYDPYPILATAALSTERIRIGTLVSNPILRAPAILANEAVTLDHLSNGRLELGLGAGIFEYDHHAVGTEPWTVKERVQRFGEYLEILDGIMRSDGKPYSFEGRHIRVRDVPTAPPPVQQPRPTIIVGGQAPTILRDAARFADVWNTNGAYGAGVDDDAGMDEVIERTRQQNRRLDELCEQFDRDPAALRRSALCDPDITTMQRFVEVGIQDFVIVYEAADAVERFAAEVMPSFR